MAGGVTRPDFTHRPGGAADVVDVEHGTGFSLETWRLEGSVGDTVTADCWLAQKTDAVVVIGHGVDNWRKATYATGSGKHWSRRGLTVVAADAPFHGDRADSGRGPERVGTDPGLLGRWVRDHRLLIDAIEARFPGTAIGFVGISMGGLFGVPLASVDDRIASLVVVVAGSTRVSYPIRFPYGYDEMASVLEVTDPAVYAAQMARRPVLMVNADADELVPRESALALYDAFAPPREITFFPGTHAEWLHPGQWNRRILAFLQRTLVGMTRSGAGGSGP